MYINAFETEVLNGPTELEKRKMFEKQKVLPQKAAVRTAQHHTIPPQRALCQIVENTAYCCIFEKITGTVAEKP